MEVFGAFGSGAEEVEEDLGAGLAGADDGDVAGGEEAVAVAEVVGGVEYGDAFGFGEGFEGSGTKGSVPMPRAMWRA